MNKILIIGGAGFIGQKLISILDKKDVTIFDNLSPIVHNKESISRFIDMGVDYIVGDITNDYDVDMLFSGNMPEVVINLAAETGTGRSLYNCKLNVSVNDYGWAGILDKIARKKEKPKKLIITSSRAVYGEGPYTNNLGDLIYPKQRLYSDLLNHKFEYKDLSPVPMCAEEHMSNPSNVYGITKYCQESLAENWAKSFNIKYVILRLQNVYGGGQSISNPYTGVLVHFINALKKGERIQIYENGGITRDFIHVIDVANVIEKSINEDVESGVYDIGYGDRIKLDAIAKKLSKIIGGKDPVICDLFRLGDVRHACANIAIAKNKLNWKPLINIDKGLNELVEYYDV